MPWEPREPGAPGGPPLLFSRPGPEQLREAPEQPREPGADASSSPIRLFIKIPLNPPPTPGPPDTHSIRHPPVPLSARKDLFGGGAIWRQRAARRGTEKSEPSQQIFPLGDNDRIFRPGGASQPKSIMGNALIPLHCGSSFCPLVRSCSAPGRTSFHSPFQHEAKGCYLLWYER